MIPKVAYTLFTRVSLIPALLVLVVVSLTESSNCCLALAGGGLLGGSLLSLARFMSSGFFLRLSSKFICKYVRVNKK